MKLSGSYQFQAPSQKVFQALSNPAALQASIPGCEAVWYPDETHMKVRVMSPLPLPGMQGPYDVTVRVKDSQEPHLLVLQAGRSGRVGGTINTETRITIEDAVNGSLLTYDAQAELQGPIAFANNPVVQEVVKHSLNAFLKKLNATITS